MSDAIRPATLRRLNAWRVVVIGTLLADGLTAAYRSLPAVGIAEVMLVAMLMLLLTTPCDAIVLPREMSERIVLIGAVAIYAIAWFSGGSATIALVAMGVDMMLLLVCRLIRVSAWWTALLAWQPGVILAIHSLADTPG